MTTMVTLHGYIRRLGCDVEEARELAIRDGHDAEEVDRLIDKYWT